MTPELVTTLVMSIVGCLGALTFFLKSRSDVATIKAERSETKEQRDKDSQELHDKVIKIECAVESHDKKIERQSVLIEKSSNEIACINKTLAELNVNICNILDCIKEIKDDYKVIRNVGYNQFSTVKDVMGR